MKEFLIKHLLGWLAGITARQWATAVMWVAAAAKDARYKSGSERKAAVSAFIQGLWPDIQGWALNLLIETAVAFQRKAK